MTAKKDQISRNDVAVAAGVSPATVSLVVRNSPLVKASTREHVQKFIKQMGYEPNAAAKALRSARANALGYMRLTGFSQGEQLGNIDTFHNHVIIGITGRTELVGQHVLVNTFVDTQQCVSLVKSRKIDGLLVDWDIEDSVLKELGEHEIPLVVVGRRPSAPGISSVIADEEGGGYAAVRHLLSLGHRQIGLITGINEPHPITDRRIHGYRRALADEHLEMDAGLIAYGDWSFESGYRMALHLLSQHPRPSALFVLGEVMAAGALKACRRMSLFVPDDVAIVTSASSSLVEYTWPELTAVHIPMYEVGKKAVEVLLNLLDGGDDQNEQQIVLPTNLIIRESSVSSRMMQKLLQNDVET